ncbi:MAG: WecB/TagA/CpsF family glycosyltransferase, partial [Oscillospiraceae bacterium]|nr:WecB/TagA/CpsF family glycosyltransferase [Oscillospiraceae bacterium]
MIITNVLGLDFANASIAECVEYALQLMENDKTEYVVAPDSEMMHEISENKRLRSAVKGASIILPAGNGLLAAASILGYPIKDRVCAIDFAGALLARMSEKGMSVYVYGPEYDSVEIVKENISYKYPGLKIFGGDEDYYYNEMELVSDINDVEPDLILACQGTPRQEYWMYRHKDELKAGLMLGFGDGFSYFAGETERAPKRWRDSG